MLKAQQEEEEKIKKQEKYEFTKFICSVHNDYRSMENNCFKKQRETEEFRSCLSDIKEKQYELQRNIGYYERTYGEKFSFKSCKQFIIKNKSKIIKRKNKK